MKGPKRCPDWRGLSFTLVPATFFGIALGGKLTTRAFAELKAHPEIGRAEALRNSMK
jgi:hypothetical protein